MLFPPKIEFKNKYTSIRQKLQNTSNIEPREESYISSIWKLNISNAYLKNKISIVFEFCAIFEFNNIYEFEKLSNYGKENSTSTDKPIGINLIEIKNTNACDVNQNPKKNHISTSVFLDLKNFDVNKSCVTIDSEIFELLEINICDLLFKKISLTVVKFDNARNKNTISKNINIIEDFLINGYEMLLRHDCEKGCCYNIFFIRDDFINKLTEFAYDSVDSKFEKSGKFRDAIFPKKRGGQPETLGHKLQSEIPVLIPCFNNPFYCDHMLNQLKCFGFKNIVFVDNASTSQEMIYWLERACTDASVLRLRENKGPRDSIFENDALRLLPRRFCVTDPDIEFNRALPSDFVARLASIAEEYRVGKVGFALDISDRHKMVSQFFKIGSQDYQIWDWEERFWKRPIGNTIDGDRIFAANIDTTFALYDKKYFNNEHFLTALRVSGKFTAKHLPWYLDSKTPESEEEMYRASQVFSTYLPS